MFQYDKYGKNTNATQKSEIIYRLHSMKGLIRIYFRHLTALHKFNPHNKYKYSNKTWLIDMYSSLTFSEYREIIETLNWVYFNEIQNFLK